MDAQFTVELAEVRRAASWLLGQPVRGPFRTLEMERFEFGPDVEFTMRRTGPQQAPRFAIHAQCPWRIARAGQVLVAYSDFDAPNPEAPDPEPWAFRDARMQALHAAGPNRVVVSVAVSDLGDLSVVLSDGATIELFVDQSRSAEECYRVLDRLGDHVVVMGGPRIVVTPRGESADGAA